MNTEPGNRPAGRNNRTIRRNGQAVSVRKQKTLLQWPLPAPYPLVAEAAYGGPLCRPNKSGGTEGARFRGKEWDRGRPRRLPLIPRFSGTACAPDCPLALPHGRNRHLVTRRSTRPAGHALISPDVRSSVSPPFGVCIHYYRDPAWRQLPRWPSAAWLVFPGAGRLRARMARLIDAQVAASGEG